MKTVVLFLGFSMMATLFTADFAVAVNPTGYGQAGGEFDIRVKRGSPKRTCGSKKNEAPI